MRKYESILIFDPALPEEQLKKECKKLEGVLTSNGVASVSVNPSGKKELAYKVAKQKLGNFVTFAYETDNHEAVNALTAQLRLTESIIKYQSHRLPERARKFKGRPGRGGSGAVWGDDEFSDEAEVR